MDVAKKHSFASVLSNFELKGYLAPFRPDGSDAPLPDQPVDSYSRRDSIDSSKDSFYTLDDEPLSDRDDEPDKLAETPRPGSRASSHADSRPSHGFEATPRGGAPLSRTKSPSSESITGENQDEFYDAADEAGDDADYGITEEELRELEDELSPAPRIKSRKLGKLLGADPTAAEGSQAPTKPRAKDFADIMLGEGDDRVVDRLFGSGEMDGQSFAKRESHIPEVRRKLEWRATASGTKQKEADKRAFADLIMGGDASEGLTEKIFGDSDQPDGSSRTPLSPSTPKPPHASSKSKSNATDFADLVMGSEAGGLADKLFGSGELADQSYDPAAARRTAPRPVRALSNGTPLQEASAPDTARVAAAANGLAEGAGEASYTGPASPEPKPRKQPDFADLLLSKDDTQLDRLFGGELADQTYDRTLAKRSATATPRPASPATPGAVPPRTSSSAPTQRAAAVQSSSQRVSRPASPETDELPNTTPQSTPRPLSFSRASRAKAADRNAAKRISVSDPVAAPAPQSPRVPPVPSIPSRRKSANISVRVTEALFSNPPNIRALIRTPPAAPAEAPPDLPPPPPTAEQRHSLRGRPEPKGSPPIPQMPAVPQQPTVPQQSTPLQLRPTPQQPITLQLRSTPPQPATPQLPTTPQQPAHAPPPPPPQQSPPEPPAQHEPRASTDSSGSSASSASDATSETTPPDSDAADLTEFMYQDRYAGAAAGSAASDSQQGTPRPLSRRSDNAPTPNHKPSLSLASAVTTDTTDTTDTAATDDSAASEISAHDLSAPPTLLAATYAEAGARPSSATPSTASAPQPRRTGLLRLPPRTSSLLARATSFDSVAPPPISLGQRERGASDPARAASVGSAAGRFGSLRQSLMRRGSLLRRQSADEARSPHGAGDGALAEQELLAHSVSYESAARGRAPFLSREVAEIYPVAAEATGGRRNTKRLSLLPAPAAKKGNVPIGLEVLREYAVNEQLEKQGLRLSLDRGWSFDFDAASEAADGDDDEFRTPPMSARSAKRLSVLMEE